MTEFEERSVQANPVAVWPVGKTIDGGTLEGIQAVTQGGKTSLLVVSGFAKTQSIHIDVQTNSTLIAYMLIDISDTTNWKHTNTDHIIIEYIIIELDPAPNFLGEVKIGYLKNVDDENGDFVNILDIDMARKSDLLVETIDFGSHGLHCSDNHHFGPVIANSTLFQTDVDLAGPDGATDYPSGNGDLCLIVDGDGTNIVDVSITIGYETVA